MQRTNSELVATALALHERLIGKVESPAPVYLPKFAWSKVVGLERQLETARQRGWHGAAKCVHDDLVMALNDFRRQLDDIVRKLDVARFRPHQELSATDIYGDLTALNEEFEQVTIDLKEETLTVTTDAIELDGVYLGPFEIRLHWKRIGQSSPAYRVIALDPNPASKSEDITHPHVQAECLCEGDGRTAIAAALSGGRFLDFFTLVSQVLHTYGRGSAYVELKDWDGVPCSDCGSVVDEDDRYFCHRCASTLCDECSHTCHGCSESFCSNCLTSCAVCEDEYCSNCLNTCPACDRSVCDGCQEGELCRNCHEEQQEEEEHDQPEDDCEPEIAAAAA